MIALEHEHVTVPECHLDIWRHVAEIGGNGNAYSIRFKHETNRVGRVVRNGERGNGNISDGKAVARGKVSHPGKTAGVRRLFAGGTLFLFRFHFSSGELPLG